MSDRDTPTRPDTIDSEGTENALESSNANPAAGHAVAGRGAIPSRTSPEGETGSEASTSEKSGIPHLQVGEEVNNMLAECDIMSRKGNPRPLGGENAIRIRDAVDAAGHMIVPKPCPTGTAEHAAAVVTEVGVLVAIVDLVRTLTTTVGTLTTAVELTTLTVELDTPDGTPDGVG